MTLAPWRSHAEEMLMGTAMAGPLGSPSQRAEGTAPTVAAAPRSRCGMYPVVLDQEASNEYWQGVEADFEAANDDIDLVIEQLPLDNRDEKIATADRLGTRN